MRGIVLILALIAIHQVFGQTSLTFKRETQTDASFSISLNGNVWFQSTYFRLYAEGQWWELNEDTLMGWSQVDGTDSIGAYNSFVFEWKTGNAPFNTSVKVYPEVPNVIVFGQSFPNGATGTVLGSTSQPLSIFPSLQAVAPGLGFLHYRGDMGGAGFSTGLFPQNLTTSDIESGPLVVFDKNYNTVILTPLSYFISVITGVNTTDKSLQVGIQGKVESLPAGFEFEYILFAGSGINNAMLAWGDLMLAKYQKTRVTPSASTVISHLGYSTTAYYFYNPLDGNASYGNYEETLLQVHAYAQQIGVPYRYYLIDSWWYGEEQEYKGVWMWEDNHDLLQYRFPHGLEWLRDQLGVPFAAHIGKWVSSTPYAKNPDYGFIVEPEWAISPSLDFWDYIFQNASGWGLNTLKQDHIDEQILDMDVTLSDVTTVRDWLLNQGRAAFHHGVNIEYCMDWPSITLTSLENPTATHSRGSTDYLPAWTWYQWKMGATSMFLWAIGLVPDKDTWYTTTTEVVSNPASQYYKYQEPWPWTHAICAALSAGPVTPSDGIGGTDVDQVNSLIMADGLLLKPDRPAVNIDSTWIQRTIGSGGSIGPQGEVITTYTQISGLNFHFVFGVQLAADYTFLSTDLLLPLSSSKNYARLDSFVNNTRVESFALFGAQNPFVIPQGLTYGDAYLYLISPVLQNGYTLLGESSKFVSVSKQRFESIEVAGQKIELLIRGVTGEQVNLLFMSPVESIETYSCTVSTSGRVLLTVPDNTCVEA